MQRTSLVLLAAAAILSSSPALGAWAVPPAQSTGLHSGDYEVVGTTTFKPKGAEIALVWLRVPETGKSHLVELDAAVQLSGLGVLNGAATGATAARLYLRRDTLARVTMARRAPTVAAVGEADGRIPVAATAQAVEILPPPGTFALFNGKDLTGWQGLVELPTRQKLAADPAKLAAAQQAANEKCLPHWTVVDGVLHYDGKGNSLQTARDYGDFELWVEYKIGPRGDSGIYLRGTPQVQIWDPADRREGSGGLYNNKIHRAKPLKCADRPAGEWNALHILMRGEKVTVYLNGELVVDQVTMENYWNRKLPIPATGPIELQHHQHPLAFRSIYLREL
jgi:hypothetical protein